MCVPPWSRRRQVARYSTILRENCRASGHAAYILLSGEATLFLSRAERERLFSHHEASLRRPHGEERRYFDQVPVKAFGGKLESEHAPKQVPPLPPSQSPHSLPSLYHNHHQSTHLNPISPRTRVHISLTTFTPPI